MPLIYIRGLGSTESDLCHPPVTRIPRGRLKKERFRKEEARRPRRRAGGEYKGLGMPSFVAPGRCGTCGE